MNEARILVAAWLVVIAVAAVLYMRKRRRSVSKPAVSQIPRSRTLGLTYEEFKRTEIFCYDCGWEGLGADMDLGEVHEGGGLSEYHCPECGEYYGAVPWPKINAESPTSAVPE